MSETPSFNFYRKWLHDVGGIEQEAGEALMVRIDELESALGQERGAREAAEQRALTAKAEAWDESRQTIVDYIQGHVSLSDGPADGMIDQHVVVFGTARIDNPYRP